VAALAIPLFEKRDAGSFMRVIVSSARRQIVDLPYVSDQELYGGG